MGARHRPINVFIFVLTVIFLSSIDASRGIDTFVKGLLKRFVSEANPELRLLLASVLGEIGAVSPTDIEGDSSVESKESDGGLRWTVEKGAPWKSNSVRIHYELQLVTNYFITALKAAPSPTDQHKIGFAIQEGKCFFRRSILFLFVNMC